MRTRKKIENSISNFDSFRIECMAPIFAPSCREYTRDEGCILKKTCNYQFEIHKKFKKCIWCGYFRPDLLGEECQHSPNIFPEDCQIHFSPTR